MNGKIWRATDSRILETERVVITGFVIGELDNLKFTQVFITAEPIPRLKHPASFLINDCVVLIALSLSRSSRHHSGQPSLISIFIYGP
jgi:hypothetical protein